MAVEAFGKIHVIGGATTVQGSKAPFFTFMGPCDVLSENLVYDPATDKWTERAPLSRADGERDTVDGAKASEVLRHAIEPERELSRFRQQYLHGG